MFTWPMFSWVSSLKMFLPSVWTAFMLIKQYKIQRDNIPEAERLDISLPVRIIAFGFYVIIAMRCISAPSSVVFALLTKCNFSSLSLLSITSPQSPVPDLMIASGVVSSLSIFFFRFFVNRYTTSCYSGSSHFWYSEWYLGGALLSENAYPFSRQMSL